MEKFAQEFEDQKVVHAERLMDEGQDMEGHKRTDERAATEEYEEEFTQEREHKKKVHAERLADDGQGADGHECKNERAAKFTEERDEMGGEEPSVDEEPSDETTSSWSARRRTTSRRVTRARSAMSWATSRRSSRSRETRSRRSALRGATATRSRWTASCLTTCSRVAGHSPTSSTRSWRTACGAGWTLHWRSTLLSACRPSCRASACACGRGRVGAPIRGHPLSAMIVAVVGGILWQFSTSR